MIMMASMPSGDVTGATMGKKGSPDRKAYKTPGGLHRSGPAMLSAATTIVLIGAAAPRKPFNNNDVKRKYMRPSRLLVKKICNRFELT